jgi:hypothetical protein
MDYLTKYYKNLSEELERRVNLLEMMVAQATSPSPAVPTSAPAGTPGGPMGPPSPAPVPAPTAPPSSFPPPPVPSDYGGTNTPGFRRAYEEWLRRFNDLPADHPARQKYRFRTRPTRVPGKRSGGGTVN